MRNLYRSKLARNVASLYAVHFTTVLLPLLTVPYLARVLRPEGWGAVALTQSVALYFTIFILGGFSTAATRQVARARGSPEDVRDVVAGVLGAMFMLVAISAVASLAVQAIVPAFRRQPLLYYSGILWGLMEGLNLAWYFRGVEEMALASGAEVVARVTFAALVFVFVRHQGDGWKYLSVLATCSLVNTVIGLVLIYRRVPFRLPTLRLVRGAIVASWDWTVYEFAFVVYSGAGTTILGILATPAAVACYASADKIARAGRVALDPLLNACFPRISNGVVSGPGRASRHFATILLLVTAAGALIVGGALFIFAPVIIRVILGHGYEPAVGVLRIFSAMVPLYALNSVLGKTWAYPLGLDRAVNRIMVAASVLTVAIGCAVVPYFGQRGMAVCMVATQAGVLAANVFVLATRGLLPWSVAGTPRERRDRVPAAPAGVAPGAG